MDTKAIAATFLFAFAISQARGEDSCNVLIREGAHNVSLEVIKKAADDAQHQSECRSSTSSKGQSLGAGYSGASLSYGSTKSSSSLSCKEDSSRAIDNSEQMKYAREIVKEAYSAHIACKELESGQVFANFEVLPRTIVVSLKKMNDPVTFNGLTVSPENALHCTRKNPDGGEPLEVTNIAPFPLTDSKTLTITCLRNDLDPGEEVLLPAADLVVETSRKAGKMTLASSRFPAEISTKQLFAKIEDLENSLGVTRDEAGKRIGALETFATDLSGMKSPVDANVTINVENKDWWNGKCPDNHVNTGLILTTLGRGGPVNFIQLRCAQLPKFAPLQTNAPTQHVTAP